ALVAPLWSSSLSTLLLLLVVLLLVVLLLVVLLPLVCSMRSGEELPAPAPLHPLLDIALVPVVITPPLTLLSRRRPRPRPRQLPLPPRPPPSLVTTAAPLLVLAVLHDPESQASESEAISPSAPNAFDGVPPG
ncbi:hypothetical protein Vafri_9610, partial [Volvox africanus]